MLTRTNISVRLSPTRYFPSETRIIGYWVGQVHLARIWRTCQQIHSHIITSYAAYIHTYNTHSGGSMHALTPNCCCCCCEPHKARTVSESVTKRLPGASQLNYAVTRHERLIISSFRCISRNTELETRHRRCSPTGCAKKRKKYDCEISENLHF